MEHTSAPLLSLVLALVLPAVTLAACSSSHTPGGDGGSGGDEGVAVDAGPRGECDAMDARLDLCADEACDIAPTATAYWDGSACVATPCGCRGEDCDAYASVGACEAAHAGCDAALCTTTGGAWFARAEWCGHFVCGVPPEGPCLVATPACDCGAGRVFSTGQGCADGPLCELVAPVSEETLCINSGGTWNTNGCGHTACGRASLLPCVMPGCACGDLEVFDSERGCVRSPTCERRLLGEDCSATELCEGSVCCADGGASAERHCVAPQCTDPHGVCGPPTP